MLCCVCATHPRCFCTHPHSVYVVAVVLWSYCGPCVDNHEFASLHAKDLYPLGQSTLISLSLRGCAVTTSCLAKLCQLLREQPSLTLLDLSCNSRIGELLHPMAELMRLQRTLAVLRLDGAAPLLFPVGHTPQTSSHSPPPLCALFSPHVSFACHRV